MAKKRRLIWHLYPSYLLIILVSLVAVTWHASFSTRNFFLEQKEIELQSHAYLFENQILPYLDAFDEDSIDLLCKQAAQNSSVRITVILPSGRVVGDSEADPAIMDNHADRPEFKAALSGRQGTATRYSRTLDKDFMYLGLPIRENNELAAVVRVSVPLDIIDIEINNMQRRIILGGLIIAVFAAIVSLIVSRRISRPVEALKKSADYFIQEDFQRRTPVSNIEEIVALYESIKGMAGELHKRINTITRQRNEIEAILSSMVEGVIAVDMDERIISMNEAAAEMLESGPSEAKGRSVQEAVRNIAFQDFVKKSLSSGVPVEKEIALSSKGELFVNAHGTILRDEGGKQIGALIVLNDITRLKRLENIRTEFVANVSHEIKTPITAIKGFVETLADGQVKDEGDVRRFLGIITNHVSRLESIIEDLLKLSRIEKDVEEEGIFLRDEKLRHIIETAVQVCKPNAQAKGINIDLDCNEDLVARINPPLLEQAIVNLLDNAIKYSDEKKAVRIKAFQDEGEVLVEIVDQGKGIEDKHLPRLFERFYRVDKARSRSLGGTGLGLAIVKHIIQAHGGHVSVISTPGVGSTFTLHFPK
jgi:two-component system phosphate regulon sensor histidine kinase PhoR